MLYTLQKLFHIRIKQLLRVLAIVGAARILLLAVLVAGAFVFLLQTMQTPDNHAYVVLFYLFGIGTVQVSRSDKSFLYHITTRPIFVYFAENIIMLLPLLVLLILVNNWLLMLGAIAAVFGVSFVHLPKMNRTKNYKILHRIPPYLFEWQVGLRRGFLWYSIFYILSLAFSFHVAAAPVAIFVLSLVVFGFYQEVEPRQLLYAFEQTPTRFLIRKILWTELFFFALCLPLALLFCAFHTDMFAVVAVEMLVLHLLIAYIVLLKYAYYNGEDKQKIHSTLAGLGFMSLFFPVLLPIVLVSIFFFFRKAITKLRPFLEGHNHDSLC